MVEGLAHPSPLHLCNSPPGGLLSLAVTQHIRKPRALRLCPCCGAPTFLPLVVSTWRSSACLFVRAAAMVMGAYGQGSCDLTKAVVIVG